MMREHNMHMVKATSRPTTESLSDHFCVRLRAVMNTVHWKARRIGYTTPRGVS